MSKYLQHYITNLLLSQKKAYLPNIGILSTEPHSAEILKSLKFIKAPYKTIKFEHSDRVSTEKLVSQLLKWRDVDCNTAENIAQTMENALREKLLEGRAEIPGIGVLKNTENGIFFEEMAEDESVFRPYKSLSLSPLAELGDEEDSEDTSEGIPEEKVKAEKEIAATAGIVSKDAEVEEKKARPEDREEKVAEIEEEQPAEKAIPEEDRSDVNSKRKKSLGSVLFYILTIALLMALAFSLWWFRDKLKLGSKATEKTEQVETREDLGMDSEQTTAQVSVSAEEVGAESNEEIKEAESRTEEDAMPEEISRSHEGEEEEAEKQQVVVPQQEEELAEESAKSVTEPPDSDPVAQSRVNLGLGNREATRTADGQCIIIVGAFRNTANVNAMISRIEKMGRTAYSDTQGGLTRVGMKTGCSESELREALQFCRSNIEGKSWIL